ncbi:MAG: histidine--tRNA ligase, partial [Clostridia bacterium]|nr:histidine--tRNA ligase [Clostridia bacterium]
SIGCPNCRKEYNEKLKNYFGDYIDELCETCKNRLEKNPMRIIDCKVPHCEEIGATAPKILNEQCPECMEHYNKLCKYLDVMGIDYEIDDTIVRGLDYYTTTVFEIKSEGLVVCGGGRYNGLVEELGGKPTPGVGFGLGLERLLMVLESQGLLPEAQSDVQIYVSNIGEEADLFAQKLVNDLRLQGISAEKDLMSRSLKAQMKYADKIGAKYTVVIGEDEIKKGVVSVKNMLTGEQNETAVSDLAKVVSGDF